MVLKNGEKRGVLLYAPGRSAVLALGLSVAVAALATVAVLPVPGAAPTLAAGALLLAFGAVLAHLYAASAARIRLGELEDKAAAAVAELDEANRRAESAELARKAVIANVNHEFRTPLNSVIGFAELLCEGEVDSERAEMARCVREAGWRLMDMVNALVHAAEATAGAGVPRRDPFTLEELVGSVAARNRAEADKRGSLLETAWNGSRVLVGDLAMLENILGILVDNALKYGNGGKVSVAARELAVSDGSNVLVECSVKDQGDGIAPEVLDRLFRPFELGEPTLTKRYEGIGVGLYTAKRLAESLRAEIRLESAKHAGTTAYLVVPLEVGSEGGPAS